MAKVRIVKKNKKTKSVSFLRFLILFLALSFIAAFLVGGFTLNPKENTSSDNKIYEDIKSQDVPEQSLDYQKIKVGDKINNMTVQMIKKDLSDSYTIEFEGLADIRGEITSRGYGMGDALCIHDLDSDSIKALPDGFNASDKWICLDKESSKLIGISKSGTTMRLRIKDFVINSNVSAVDQARLVEILN